MERALDIEWTPKATRDLRRLAPLERGRVIEKVEQYAANPESLRNQVARLLESAYFRLRIGDYRVLFTIEETAIAIMVVARVRHRREANGRR